MWFHPVATGEAAVTVEAHNKPQDLTLWSTWFDPFSHRPWIALEEKQVPYQFRNTNPFLQEPSFLGVSPRGLVPALTVADGRPVNDSIIICEYIEDAFPSAPSLFPQDPYERSVVRTWVDRVNKGFVPCFFRLMQAQPTTEPEAHEKALQELYDELSAVCANWKGPFFLGEKFSLVDIAIGPWAVRDFIVERYRGFERQKVKGWTEWAEALASRPSIAKTTSEKYVEFNQTFLRNESHSRVAIAARSGRSIL
ncbi:glutathione S-transferase [Rhizodiscina lignyota]|uniref:Glutathione S-transferase n=1 Tax=Rhizodiscina lignyota TaxID=1504668 RepID=A0A9P4ICQ6_9PEZI|nr:glutathione S-transferase [Rhizodiscina lignyota]